VKSAVKIGELEAEFGAASITATSSSILAISMAFLPLAISRIHDSHLTEIGIEVSSGSADAAITCECCDQDDGCFAVLRWGYFCWKSDINDLT